MDTIQRLLNEEIPFGAVDGKPVFILFVMLSPDTTHHLKLLSRLSFCLRDNDFISVLQKRPAPEVLYRRVQEMENRMAASMTCRGDLRIE